MKKLVIFDLDGTLLNTLNDLAEAGNHALREYGLPTHPVEAFRTFVGNGVYTLIERMAPPELRGDTRMLTRLKEIFEAYYAQHSADLTAPYDGVPALLEQLAQKNIVMTVLSNKPHVFTNELVSRFFAGKMAVVHGQREGYPTKPDRSLVDEILSLTGFTADETIYIGDSGVDMQTACNAGVIAIGALWGFRDRIELKENGAAVCISHPAELLKYL